MNTPRLSPPSPEFPESPDRSGTTPRLPHPRPARQISRGWKATSIGVLGVLAFALAVTPPAPAESLQPSSYTFVPPANNGSLTYQDDTGRQLIDGIVGGDSWGSDIGNGQGYEWIGWQFGSPEITFRFPVPVTITNIAIGLCREEVFAPAWLPSSVTIRGDTFPLTGNEIPNDRRGFVSFAGSWTGDTLVVKLNEGGRHPGQALDDWIFADEVQFEGTPPNYAATGALVWSTRNGKIKIATLDGGPAAVIASNPVPPGNGSAVYRGFAIDAAGGYLYAGDGANVFRIRLDGTGRQNLVAVPRDPIAQAGVSDILLDSARGRLFWMNNALRLWTANVDGSNARQLIDFGHGGPAWVDGLALSPDGNTLFMSDPVAVGGAGIMAFDLATQTWTWRWRADAQEPNDMDFDPQRGLLYWCDTRSGGLYRGALDGSGAMELAVQAVPNATGLALTTDGNTLYFTQSPDIWRDRLDGSPKEKVLTDPDGVFYLGVITPTPATVLSLNAPSIAEGDQGTRILTFEATLSAAAALPVTVDWDTADGTATVLDADYLPASGTIQLAPGQTATTLAVTILGDRVTEPDETFRIRLHNPVNTTLAAPESNGTILNDDSLRILRQPGDQTLNPWESATLAVEASGAPPLTYQWYVGTSGNTGNSVSGGTQATLTTPFLFDSTQFWVRVTDPTGFVDSETAHITVRQAPTITAQPGDATVNPGETTLLSAQATGTPPLHFQWYSGPAGDTSNPLAGADSPSYTPTPPPASTRFWVRVSNAAGHADSTAARITLRTAPALVSPPADTLVNPGESATLSVVASGTDPLEYHWYVVAPDDSASPVPGADGPTFTTPRLAESTRYRVRVANPAGSVDSPTVVVSLRIPPTIVQSAPDQTINPGQSVTLEVVASGTVPFAYQWYAAGPEEAFQPIPDATSPTFVSPPLDTPVSYRVRISNPAGIADSDVTRVTVRTPPSIVRPPTDRTVGPGETVTFEVQAAGTPPLAYQWQRNGTDLAGRTEPILTLPEVTLADAGLYRVRVSNLAGSAVSPAAGLVVGSAPAITTHPLGQSVPLGGSILLSAVAIAPGGAESLTYQWRLNGYPLPSATNTMLSLTNLTPSSDGDYTFQASNTWGAAVSIPARLEVVSPPVILEPPAATLAFTGMPAELRVVARAGSQPRFTWYQDHREIPGATNASLTISSARHSDAGRYSVQVANLAGSVTSPEAELRVFDPLVVTQPRDALGSLGGRAFFTVNAQGSGPFTYQWRLNGQSIPAVSNPTANTATLVIEPVHLADAGVYSVVVAGAAETFESEPVELIIPELQRVPAADPFARATPLLAPSGTLGLSTEGATREPEETWHAGKPGQHSVWFRWTAPAAGRMQISTVGSSFDTLLAVYTGDQVSSNSLDTVAFDEDSGGYFTSELRFTATPGTTYRIAVDGLGGAAGTLVFSWAFAADALPVPRIVTQPIGSTQPEGADPVELQVTATDATGYQWLRNSIEIPGATNPTLRLGPFGAEQVGVYRVRVRGPGGEVTSQPVSMELGDDPRVRSYDKLAELLAVAAEPAGPQLQNRRRLAPGLPPPGWFVVNQGYWTTHGFDTTDATTGPGESQIGARISRAGVVFGLDLTEPGTLQITVQSAPFDVDLSLSPENDRQHVTHASTNGLLRVETLLPGRYILEVGGDGVGYVLLQLVHGQPPIDHSRPVPLPKIPGQELVLHAPPIPPGPQALVRWNHLGSPVTGWTSNITYRIQGTNDSGALGLYTVDIDNGIGRATRAVALVERYITPALATDPATRPHWENGRFVLHVVGSPGQRLAVLAGDDLAQWSVAADFWCAASGTNRFEDPTAGTRAYGFYQVIEQPLQVVPAGQVVVDGQLRTDWRVLGGHLGHPFDLDLIHQGATNRLRSGVVTADPLHLDTPVDAQVVLHPDRAP